MLRISPEKKTIEIWDSIKQSGEVHENGDFVNRDYRNVGRDVNLTQKWQLKTSFSEKVTNKDSKNLKISKIEKGLRGLLRNYGKIIS